jgi:hypothetical protein
MKSNLPKNEKIRPISRYRRSVAYIRKKITAEDIKNAIEHTKSGQQAARYLGIHYITYRKYAKMYYDIDGKSFFEKRLNQSGVGIRKFQAKDKMYPMEDLLNNKFPDYHPTRLKSRLIAEGYLPEKCAHCGYHTIRPLDNKVPLILNFLDNNITNYKIDNLELLCYNCYFLLVGTPMNPFKVYNYPRLVDRPKMEPGEIEIQSS